MQRLLPALILLFAAPLAAAQIYTWTDAGGTVHFSEAPPAAGVTYREVKTSAGVTSAAPAPARPAAPEGAGDAAPEPDTAAPQRVEDTPENRKRLCATLTANITTLSQTPPASENQDVAAAEAESSRRQELVAQAQSQYQQYCQ